MRDRSTNLLFILVNSDLLDDLRLFLLASFPDGFHLHLLHHIVFRTCPLLLGFNADLGSCCSDCCQQLTGVYNVLIIRCPLHVGHCLPVGLDVLDIVIDLNVECRLINLNGVVLSVRHALHLTHD